MSCLSGVSGRVIVRAMSECPATGGRPRQIPNQVKVFERFPGTGERFVHARPDYSVAEILGPQLETTVS
jgi:hypothetical protein